MKIDLILGDCLDAMKDIEDNSIDAIITDPPYGTTACKWDSVIDFDLMWKQLNRIIKPNGSIILFGSEPFSSALRMSNIKNYKYDWIWIKTRPSGLMHSKNMPMKKHEIVSVFSYAKIGHKSQLKNKRMDYYPQGLVKVDKIHKRPKPNGSGSLTMGNRPSLKKEFKVEFKNYPNSILNFSSVHNVGAFHPTQKPILLMEYLIKTYTNENETVLDFTMGSGTTMVACVSTNRNGIGIEQEEKYFNIAKKRVEEKKEEKDNEPQTLFNAQN